LNFKVERKFCCVFETWEFEFHICGWTCWTILPSPLIAEARCYVMRAEKYGKRMCTIILKNHENSGSKWGTFGLLIYNFFMYKIKEALRGKWFFCDKVVTSRMNNKPLGSDYHCVTMSIQRGARGFITPSPPGRPKVVCF
jgi:hypothetical protein